MKMLNFYFPFILFFLIFSCTPAEKKDEVVDVLNNGIFEPVEFKIIGGTDRGEFLIGGSDHFVEIIVKNNSNYSLTQLELVVDEDSTASMKFAPAENGATSSPGFGGNCSTTLKPKQSCSYRILYKPTLPGSLTQHLIFNYKNLIDSVSVESNLVLLAGEAASLIFEGEQINYSFGVIERTERKKLSHTLIIKNTGGLSAKNIVFSKFDAPSTSAYTILSNNCPLTLSTGAQCEVVVEFEPMNYDPGAPDGNVEVTYTSNIKMDYNRDPEGGMSSLTAYYSTLSTTIEGKVKSAGASSLEFNDLTVGNIDELNIKITNQGYKEAILQSFDIRDASNILVARCVKEATTQLVCRDPSGDLTNSSTNLALSVIPFKVIDLNNCIANVNELTYSWDLEGNISNPSIRKMGARTETIAGESCFFKVQFHPSVTFMSDGNFNDYRFNIRFDSTWKNNVTLYNHLDGDANNFKVTSAEFLAAAKFEFSLFEYNKVEYPNLDVVDNGIFSYDLGRVSLITDATYKKGLKFRVKNIGSTLGEVVSVKDAASSPHTITDTSSNLNTFYSNASHTCSYLAPSGGQCDIVTDLAPIASSNSNAALAQQEENNNLYDIQNSTSDRYKKFVIKYKDGTTYNDDMSPRLPIEIESRLTALLVRKGSLVFQDATLSGGVSSANTFVSGNIGFYYIVLKNVGTGGISHVEVDTSLPGMPSPFTPAQSTFPYAYYDEPISSGRGGADFDCYDLFSFKGSSPVSPTDGTYNVATVLDAGKSCSLTIKFKLKNNDKVILPASVSNSVNWDSYFNSDFIGTINAWENTFYNGSEFPIQIKYYDGDGILDVASGYSPSVNGYGNEYLLDEYKVKARFNKPARFVPQKPSPSLSAILWRQGYTLPAYSIAPDEWGNNLTAKTLNQMFMDNSIWLASAPVSYRNSSITNFTNKSFADNNIDYIFHAGTFKAGNTYKLSFLVRNLGQSSATSISGIASGDPELVITQNFTSSLGSNSTRAINFNFIPTTSGAFTKDFVITFKNGRKDLVDPVNLTYADQVESITIRVIAEAVDSNAGQIALSSQDYSVEYNEVLDTFTENLLAPIKNYNYYYDGYNPSVSERASFKAIRGSKLYTLKKFSFKNTGATALDDLKFFIKTGVDSTTTQNTGSGVGYKINSNTCLGTLNPGATCEVDIYFKASASEVNQSLRYGFLTYRLDTNQYRSIGYLLEFNASDPAKLKVGTINSINIYNEFGGVISGSFGINLGQYADAVHPVLTGYPSGTMMKQYKITNVSTEKASFLSQYRVYVSNSSASIPAGAVHRVYSTSKIEVELSRACFYGDDEGGALPAEEWGFNNTSVAECTMYVYYNFDDSYLGQKIPSAFNYAQLSFYDNLRASSDKLTIHIEGFVEPNLSIAPGTEITNVEADSDGNLSLAWEDFAELNAGWGLIEGYRVFYSTTTSVYSNLYEATGVSYEDVVSPEVSLSGLIPGKYYYIYITALRRTPSNKVYFSIANNFPYKEVVVPPVGSIYDYASRAIIDKFQSPEGNPSFGTKAQAISTCSSKIRTLSKNGVNVNKYKALINTQMYEFIDTDEAGNSDYNYKVVPHWMVDAAVDIAPLFSPGFDCSQQSGTDGVNKYYQKSCSDCSCNILSSVIGGDGSELPYAGHLFVEPSFVGSARCYAPQ